MKRSSNKEKSLLLLRSVLNATEVIRNGSVGRKKLMGNKDPDVGRERTLIKIPIKLPSNKIPSNDAFTNQTFLVVLS